MGRSLGSAEDPVDLSRGLYGAHPLTSRSLAARLGAQNLASLATAGRENRAAATGGHASAEAVRLRTLPNVRLVCTLHCSSLMRAGFGAKPDEYMRAIRVVSNGVRRRPCRASQVASCSSAGSVEQAFRIDSLSQVRGLFHSRRKMAAESVDTVENAGLTLVEPVDNFGSRRCCVHRPLAIICGTRRTRESSPCNLDICHLAPNMNRSSASDCCETHPPICVRSGAVFGRRPR